MTLMVLAFVCAALVCAALTYWLCTAGRRLLALDVPNARSLHAQPTPRGAGLAIVVTVLVVGGTAILMVGKAPEGLWWAAVGGMAVATVSWLDDRRPISPQWRLIVHLAAALAFILGAVNEVPSIQPAPLASMPSLLQTLVLVLAVTWLTNLYNFMDGLDGFAGGMTLIGFGACAVLAWQNGTPDFAVTFAVIAGAAAGFLAFNLPPARIFMGDVGASTLGFAVAALGLLGVWHGAIELPALLLVFSPFIVDSSVTLVRRFVAGDKVWTAHRTHFYQRLVAGGWSARRTLSAEYGLMSACALTAVGAEFWNPGWTLILVVWAVIYGALMTLVAMRERSRQRDQPTPVGASAM